MLDTIVHKHNDGSGDVTFETRQDVQPILERAKSMHNEGFHGSSEMKLAASFPNVIVDKYCNDNNITLHEFVGNKDHIKRLLNDPALEYFRVWKGQIK